MGEVSFDMGTRERGLLIGVVVDRTQIQLGMFLCIFNSFF